MSASTTCGFPRVLLAVHAVLAPRLTRQRATRLPIYDPINRILIKAFPQASLTEQSRQEADRSGENPCPT
jgi:hypothetical protein